jgi:hypothetical protein
MGYRLEGEPGWSVIAGMVSLRIRMPSPVGSSGWLDVLRCIPRPGCTTCATRWPPSSAAAASIP